MREMPQRGAKAPVFRITGTARGLREDVMSRQTRYLISMGIRTACFLLAVVSSGWLRWALFVGALVLPYLSVVFANAGRERAEVVPVTILGSGRRALEPAAPTHHGRGPRS